MIGDFYLLSEIEQLGLVVSAIGEPAKRGALMKYCNQSVEQAANGETPVFRMDDGSVGCQLANGKFWLVHKEAVRNWTPPNLGRPTEN